MSLRSICTTCASVLMAFLAGRPAAAADAAGATCTGSIDVHVVDALLHDPIAGAFVTVEAAGMRRTNAFGRLAFDGLCGEDILLEVVSPGYETARRPVALAKRSSVEIALEPIFDEVVVEEKAVTPTDMRSTTSLTAERLEAKRGLPLSEALADVPGVTQLRAGTGMAKPVVRGHFGRRLPLLFDGVRHRSQDWGLDHAPEIDPFVAGNITVVRGASGVRHGSDAIGGVILLDPPSLTGRPGFRGETHLLGVSNGLGGSVMSRAQYVPTQLPGLKLQLEGSYKRLQAARTPDYALDNTAEAEWTGGVSIRYDADRAEYRLSYRRYDADLGVCSCFRVDSAADFRAQVEQGRPVGAALYRADLKIERPFQAVVHDLALARARWMFPSFGTVTATYALQIDNRKEYDVVRQATTGPQFSFHLVTHDADVAFDHKPLHLSEHLHLNGTVGVTAMLQDHAYGGLPLVPDHQAVGAGVFLSERLSGDEFELEAGLRYDHLTREASFLRRDFLRLVRSQQIALDGCGAAGTNPDVDPVTCASRFNTLSASVGGLLRVSPRWMTKVDLSTAARPPNPDEQYLNGTAPSFPVFGYGRPDIGTETSHSASLTATFESRRVTAEVTAFANLVLDYIYFAPAIGADGQPIFDVLIRGAFPRFITRPVDAAFYGADGYIAAQILPWLGLTTHASVVRARNLTDDTFLAFVPADRVRSSVTLSRDGLFGLHKVAVSLSGSYVARQDRHDLAADLAPPPPAYFLADAMLAVDTRVAGYPVTIALQGVNLLNARYREYTSLMRYFADQPGRQVMLRLSLHFDTPDGTNG